MNYWWKGAMVNEFLLFTRIQVLPSGVLAFMWQYSFQELCFICMLLMFFFLLIGQSYFFTTTLFKVMHSSKHSSYTYIIGIDKYRKRMNGLEWVFKILSILFPPSWGLWRLIGNTISQMKYVWKAMVQGRLLAEVGSLETGGAHSSF